MQTTPAEQLADYLLDNYGICIRGSDSDCLCLKSKWLGQSCPYWKPLGATTYEQLREAQGVVRNALDKRDSEDRLRNAPNP